MPRFPRAHIKSNDFFFLDFHDGNKLDESFVLLGMRVGRQLKIIPFVFIKRRNNSQNKCVYLNWTMKQNTSPSNRNHLQLVTVTSFKKKHELAIKTMGIQVINNNLFLFCFDV